MFRTISLCFVFLVVAVPAWAVPTGYTKSTIALNAPPAGLAFAPNGTLFAFEAPPFLTNTTVVRVINPDLTFGSNLNVTGADASNLFIGAMAYDSVTAGVVITDNAGSGSLYSLTPAGFQSTIFNNVANVAGVAVRSTGEIFVSTAPGFEAGKVLQVNRNTGATVEVLGGLGFGAGLAFDPAGNLIVQDADVNAPYLGRLQRLPITEVNGSLVFGTAELLLAGMTASAGVTVDSEGDIFVTGVGGLFDVTGNPLSATSFDTNGNPFQFSTAIAFLAGANPFEPFAGGGAKLAFLSDFGFQPQFQDKFVTIITPVPEPASAWLLLIGAGICLRRWRRCKTMGA